VLNTPHICFNPCYVGLWSVRLSNGITLCEECQFQSLLCWIMVCKDFSAFPMWCGSLFQSLLCWIMVCKYITSRAIMNRLDVSILVMLDYGL